jgi:hypothetical protein
MQHVITDNSCEDVLRGFGFLWLSGAVASTPAILLGSEAEPTSTVDALLCPAHGFTRPVLGQTRIRNFSGSHPASLKSLSQNMFEVQTKIFDAAVKSALTSKACRAQALWSYLALLRQCCNNIRVFYERKGIKPP